MSPSKRDADAVTAQDVRHVAALARLGLDDAHIASLTRDMNTILDHMRALASVKTGAAGEASGVGAAGMRLREDHGPSIPLAEPLESLAPEMRDGFLIVPRLSTHEDPESGA